MTDTDAIATAAAEQAAAAAAPSGTDTPPKKAHGGRRAGAGRPKTAGTGKARAKAPAPAKPTAAKRVEQRAAALGEALVLPALPSMLIGSEFLVGHFTGTAPIIAQQLAELAERSDEVARVIDRAASGSVALGLVFCALGYIGPVALHVLGRSEQAAAASQGVQLLGNPALLQTMMAAAAMQADMPEANVTVVP